MNTMTRQLEDLYDAVAEARNAGGDDSRTAELLRAGSIKIAKKLMEESAEVSLAYTGDRREEVIRETADLLYNLIVLLVDRGIPLSAVWDEMEARRSVLGIAAKVPKSRRSDVEEAAGNSDG